MHYFPTCLSGRDSERGYRLRVFFFRIYVHTVVQKLRIFSNIWNDENQGLAYGQEEVHNYAG